VSFDFYPETKSLAVLITAPNGPPKYPMSQSMGGQRFTAAIKRLVFQCGFTGLLKEKSRGEFLLCIL
jgi:hypothetical protein